MIRVMTCVAVMVAAAGQVRAGMISTVDQQNVVDGTSISSSQLYQTFVPTLAGIDSVELSLRNVNPSNVPTVYLLLFDGAAGEAGDNFRTAHSPPYRTANRKVYHTTVNGIPRTGATARPVSLP